MSQQEATSRIYVGNLDPSITEQQLEAEVAKFSTSASVWVAHNPPGFAFVEFATIPEAEACLNNLNGTRLGQQYMRVEFAKTKGRKEPPITSPPAGALA